MRYAAAAGTRLVVEPALPRLSEYRSGEQKDRQILVLTQQYVEVRRLIGKSEVGEHDRSQGGIS